MLVQGILLLALVELLLNLRRGVLTKSDFLLPHLSEHAHPWCPILRVVAPVAEYSSWTWIHHPLSALIGTLNRLEHIVLR